MKGLQIAASCNSVSVHCMNIHWHTRQMHIFMAHVPVLPDVWCEIERYVLLSEHLNAITELCMKADILS